MSHRAQALVLHCIDFRLPDEIKEFLASRGLARRYDLVSLAGGVKSLVAPENESEKNFILKQIEISSRLHQIKEVYLINHSDCGAYGGRKAFGSEDKEREKHLEDLKQAQKIISDKLPHLNIKLIWIQLEKGRIAFEEVN